MQTTWLKPIINGDGKPWLNYRGDPMMAVFPTTAGRVWSGLQHIEAMMGVVGL
jgi:hypothetical protein